MSLRIQPERERERKQPRENREHKEREGESRGIAFSPEQRGEHVNEEEQDEEQANNVDHEHCVVEESEREVVLEPRLLDVLQSLLPRLRVLHAIYVSTPRGTDDRPPTERREHIKWSLTR